MLSKVAIALPLAASLLDQVSAFSFHRHQHAAAKRDDNIVYETVFTTVYVTAGADSSPAETAANAFVQDTQPSIAVTAAASEPAAAAAPAQTTLSTAVKPAASSTASSTGSGKGLGFSKQGIAYNDVSMANTFKKGCDGCGWGYNWASNSNGLDSSMQYIPMLWGDLPVHTSHWDADAEAAISKGAKALLSFNEPDMASQANMSPEAAAAAHAKYFSAYKGRAQIGSPAVSNGASPTTLMGIDWLKQFVAACDANSDCHYDFCVVHWYSEVQYADTLFTHLKAAHDACHGKPVWLTEFAPTAASDDQISSFLKSTLPKLDSLDYLDAYSYFMVSQNVLMSSNSLLSAIGNVYAAIAT